MNTIIVYECQRVWAKDWSKNVLIEANARQIRRFRRQLYKLVGKEFGFELSLETKKPPYFIDDKNGLIAY